MTEPLRPTKRKNPILKTRAPTRPPWGRSRVALGLTAAAAEGRFELQTCRDCSHVQYPPRDACANCLSIRLDWQQQDGAGELLSLTELQHSNDLFFRERLPWSVGLVKLEVGPTVVVHVHGDCSQAPTPVRVDARLDRAGQGVLIAFPKEDVPNMSDDKMLREMTCDPKLRKVLVTDGKTEMGQAMTKALVKAGASLVWVGHSDPWKKTPGFDDLKSIPEVSLQRLDVTDAKNVKELAGEIGGRVDILINTAEVHRTHGITSRYGTDVARLEMEVNYLGLLRLAQEFGPAMRGRGADGQNSACAWVNLLSIFALSNFPAHGTFSASKAAALSLSQCLRAEMQPAGVRVVNVFPGPIEEPWNDLVPPPKLLPARLAKDIVKALQDGVEDVYPGDVAQEWRERFKHNPKVLERELAVNI